MKDVAMTVRQDTSEKEKRWVTSAYGADFAWSSLGSVAGTIYLGVSAPLTTTMPCWTESCRRRFKNFFIKEEANLIWLSTVFFVKDLVPQYYWQYAPAQYYVEMVPEKEKPTFNQAGPPAAKQEIPAEQLCADSKRQYGIY